MITIDLDMIFEFGMCNGAMSMDILANGQLVNRIHNNTQETLHISQKIQLPCEIKILLSGKNLEDTLVQDGKIIADKYVKLKSLSLGKIPVKEHVLFNICEVNDELRDTYWGRNGTVVINFDSDNFLKWHMAHRNVF